MSRVPGPGLPAAITLPLAAVIESDHLALVLGGPSRQLIHYWRKRFGFPSFVRDGQRSICVTDHVADWLIGRGVKVRRL